MLQVVLPLLRVAARRVEGGDGLVRRHPVPLDHVAAHQVARAVEAVGAVHADQTLGVASAPGGGHGAVELVHDAPGGHHVARHEDLVVSEAEVAAGAGLVVAAGVGQVDDVLQSRDGSLQLRQVPFFVLAQGNFKSYELGSLHHAPDVGIIFPPVRYLKFNVTFGHFANG